MGVCTHCRQGGAILKQLAARGPLTDRARREIQRRHNRCPGGTWCFCQHLTERPACGQPRHASTLGADPCAV